MTNAPNPQLLTERAVQDAFSAHIMVHFVTSRDPSLAGHHEPRLFVAPGDLEHHKWPVQSMLLALVSVGAVGVRQERGAHERVELQPAA